MPDVVLRADKLAKTFRLGFLRKRIQAVREVSFQVHRGEVFGFLGPNGAGKTTTLKMLMGLIFPSAGRAEVLGLPVPTLAAKRRLGYLPETPYFYDYLTPEEFLDLVGALRKFSKGMLQRVGIAQSLMGDPELVVLDEPMTGLDPLGRKEIRDLILELKQEGRTVFYSTHILPDVEMTCDRVAMVFAGRTSAVGPLGQLLSARLLSTEVVLQPGAAGPPALPDGAAARTTAEGTHAVELREGTDVDAFLKSALAGGARVLAVSPRRESLEEFFIRQAQGQGGAAVRT
jgi:ABC-2 type transport system ATP-binding protein